MGYSTVTYTSPTIANLQSGMSRNVLFFVGHADAMRMYFDNGTAINNSTSSKTTCFTGYSCVGVGYGISSLKTKLAVFMGCILHPAQLIWHSML